MEGMDGTGQTRLNENRRGKEGGGRRNGTDGTEQRGIRQTGSTDKTYMKPGDSDSLIFIYLYFARFFLVGIASLRDIASRQ